MLKKFGWKAGAVVVLLIAALAINWPKELGGGKGIGFKTKELGENFSDNYLPGELKTPKQLVWQIQTPKEIKEAAYRKYELLIDSSLIEKVKKSLGFVEEEKIKEDDDFVIFRNTEGRSVMIGKKTGVINYSVDIYKQSQLATQNHLDINEIQTKIRTIVNEISNNEYEINWEPTQYKKMVVPRWVESDEKSATALVLNGNIKIENTTTVTYFGDTVESVTKLNGDLIKLKFVVLPKKMVNEPVKTAANINDLKQRSLESFGVVSISGGLGFEKDWKVDEIGKITITEIDPVLVVDNRTKTLRPYYSLKGNAWSTTPLTVKIVTASIK